MIVDSLDTHATLDASLTAQMLVAAARIRQDDPDTGIAMLAEAAVPELDDLGEVVSRVDVQDGKR